MNNKLDYNHMLVDFTNIPEELDKSDPEFIKNKYLQTYDQKTTQYYKAHRIRLIDPFDSTQLTESNAFIFPHIWNPYTGEIIGIDPFGPLYFSPVNLILAIYAKRLFNLWIEPSNERGGYFQGYYGDNVGIGDKFNIPGKGMMIERNIFRLPMIDCYLPNLKNDSKNICNNSMSRITMGPLLTDENILMIDNLIKNYWESDPMIKRVYREIKSLKNLKNIYDIAIHPTPLELDHMYLKSLGLNVDTAHNHSDPNQFINRGAVDILRRM
jgi:hypothetical protein